MKSKSSLSEKEFFCISYAHQKVSQYVLDKLEKNRKTITLNDCMYEKKDEQHLMTVIHILSVKDVNAYELESHVRYINPYIRRDNLWVTLWNLNGVLEVSKVVFRVE